MNFFDRKPAGWHVSQLLPWPYMALIPIWEPSVMTHTGSFLLKSTGFNIGDRIYPVEVSTGRFGCFVLTLTMVQYMPLYLACIVPDIALVQETFGLCYNFRDFSIPWFTTFPDSRPCLRISQVLTSIDRIATLWVIGALSLCALYALGCSESILISSRYMCTNLPRNSWNIAIINRWNVEGALQSPICITWLWKVPNVVENFILQTPSALCVSAHKLLSYPTWIWI